jgi:hypothetical protein
MQINAEHKYALFLTYLNNFELITFVGAGPGGRTVKGLSLLPLVCWDCGFESRMGVGVCLLWVFCVSASG